MYGSHQACAAANSCLFNMENKQRIVLPSLGNIRMDRTRSQLRRFIGVMVCIAANKFAGAYPRAGHLKKLTNITANNNRQLTTNHEINTKIFIRNPISCSA